VRLEEAKSSSQGPSGRRLNPRLTRGIGGSQLDQPGFRLDCLQRHAFTHHRKSIAIPDPRADNKVELQAFALPAYDPVALAASQNRANHVV
jgi:hypothetical protein